MGGAAQEMEALRRQLDFFKARGDAYYREALTVGGGATGVVACCRLHAPSYQAGASSCRLAALVGSGLVLRCLDPAA